MGRSEDALLSRRNELEKQAALQRERLLAGGRSLTDSLTIRLSFHAPSDAAARELAAALVRNGMSVPVVVAPDTPATDERWGLQIALKASIDFVTRRENLVTFLLFADEFECEFDGWDVLPD